MRRPRWRARAAATCVAASAVAACAAAGRSVALEPAPVLAERQVALMGTIASLATWADDRDEALRRLARFLDTLDAAEDELSTWRRDTPLARINHTPIHTRVPIGDPELCRTLGDVFDWHARTDGAFDPAIGPLIDAWGLRAEGRIPTDAELQRARRTSGLRHITFDRAACSIARAADTWIDSGAFGKGEALDRLRSAPDATSAGEAWLVDLGGQIAVNGAPPGEAAWLVPVADPSARDRALFTLEVTGGSIAVTGGSERDLHASGRRIGHVLDPRSGLPAEFAGEVIVWHERALIADILSTALYVMGEAAGLAFAEAQGVAACFVVRDGGMGPRSYRVTVSPRFAQAFGRPAPTAS